MAGSSGNGEQLQEKEQKLQQTSSSPTLLKKTTRVRFSKVREEIYETSEDEEDLEEFENLSNAEDWAETVEDMDDFFEAFEGDRHPPLELIKEEECGENDEPDAESLAPLDYYSQPRLFTGLNTSENIHSEDIFSETLNEPPMTVRRDCLEFVNKIEYASDRSSESGSSSMRRRRVKSKNHVSSWISSSVRRATLLKKSLMKKNKPDIFSNDGYVTLNYLWQDVP